MSERIEHTAIIPIAQAGQRFDRALATIFPQYSRSRLQAWLKSGAITVDTTVLRAKDLVCGGEQVRLSVLLEEEGAVAAEPIALRIVYEDDSLLVIDKPPSLIVHPGAGHAGGTLQNALLHYDPRLAGLPRAGIVHRLDKGTSGLMVVARNLTAHKLLVEQLQARSVKRDYLALVSAVVTSGGRATAAIGRHRRDRTRMAVRQDGRAAVTHFRVVERFAAHTLLRCSLETGRTHQIRVHMAWLRQPVVGDPVYGGRTRLPKGASEELKTALSGFRRQALHALELRLVHPATEQAVGWHSPLPADYAYLLEVLRGCR
ncbi:23S rRNA pseudouridine(1911/1915/1917) synthase RluD [Nitrococcus mobilis]|uniref:Pseudouridine synthase n=1 Tax=Nitrococcus mobilis Nb-231 TaxID=314278 RepID=A4BNG6_9GAMM|nr:23S rRNA pseudouridine(1911/1915/1917) synthase RluD [Nitrococcus mobilis]EAR22765.1 ribosomal large subunit pseudouridine synthase D [Nitrococcus mobilis Nb-231]